MKLSDLSITRPVFASMMSLALVLFGALGYQRLTVRELPDIDPPVISVQTSLRGANPRVMESSVTDVLEEELSTLEGLRTLTSSSSEQSSNITLEFTLERDIETAAQDVRDKVSRVRGRLPVDVDEPVIAKQDADARPFFYLALTAPGMDQLQLTDVADRIVRQRLQTIPGVARVQIVGERRYSMRIWLDPNGLASRGLTAQDIATAIRGRNVEIPAGRIESAQREFTVRSLGELKTPAEFADMVVSNAEGVPVKLREIARVELGPENDRSALRFDRETAIGLGVIRNSQANLIDVSRDIQAALPAIRAALPTGITLVPAFDQSVFVDPVVALPARTITVKAVAANPGAVLQAGMFIEARLATAVRVSATVIPEEAVAPTASGAFVWVVQGDKVTRREVELGVRTPGFVEVRRGIDVGDRVVVGGLERLSEGAAVRATEVQRRPQGAREK